MEDSRRTEFPSFKCCAFLGWMMKSHPSPPEIAHTPLPSIPHSVSVQLSLNLGYQIESVE